MSRAYTIRVAETQRRYLQVEDSVCTDIELLPILPAARLSEILGEELVARGFVVKEGQATRSDNDVKITVELATGRVTASVEGERDVELQVERRVKSAAQTLAAEREEEVRGELQASLEAQLDAQEKSLQKAVTEELEVALRDLQKELDEVSNRVAGTALKEKAALLGEIVELSEAEDGSLTIKVKV